MPHHDYIGNWFIEWDGLTARETLELMLRRDSRFDVRHSAVGGWMDAADFDRLEPGLTLFAAIDHCIHVVDRFEASMRAANKNALLGAFFSNAGIIDPWNKSHGHDFRALARGFEARREHAVLTKLISPARNASRRRL